MVRNLSHAVYHEFVGHVLGVCVLFTLVAGPPARVTPGSTSALPVAPNLPKFPSPLPLTLHRVPQGGGEAGEAAADADAEEPE